MDGDGTKDYFWVDHTGKGFGYLNKGKGRDVWENLGQIAFGDHPRDMIRMGVMTTSGRADYIVLDENTGRAMWYRNLGKAQGWHWGPAREIAAGPRATIQNKYGWKFRVENVRFAE